MTPEERFWGKVDRSGGPDACWPWLGYCCRRGYGSIGGVEGKNAKAHRFGWFLTFGSWPKDQLDHTCHDPNVCQLGVACPHRRCCNPAHLEDVTSRVNTLRSGTLSAINARKTHCIHGHPFSGENLIVDRWGRHCAACRWRHNHRAKKAG